MTKNPVVKTPTEQRIGSGALLELMDPDPGAIDVDIDVARPLSRIGRFTSQADRPRQESVAEHSAVGAAIALAETGRVELALAFAVHDAHEAFIGDIATPIVAALARMSMPELPAKIKQLKTSLDAAIATALGIPTTWPNEVTQYVHTLDARMYEAEYEALWCDVTNRRDKVQLALSHANQLRTELGNTYPYEGHFMTAVRAILERSGVLGGWLGRPIDIRLDLARPWKADKAAEVWLACVEELTEAWMR